MKQLQHKCPDGVVFEWKSRVESPRECPRCKQRLDKPNKEQMKEEGK